MAILSKLRRHYLAHTWRVVEGSTFVGRKLLSSAAVVVSGCALFSRIVVSSMESAAAIVVEPVTGLEYPFFAMTEVFLAFKRPYLRHANVRYCSLYLIALISGLFPVPGYTLEPIPAWLSRSARGKQSGNCAINTFALSTRTHCTASHRLPDHPAELSSSELRQVLRAISVWASQVFLPRGRPASLSIKTGGRERRGACVADRIRKGPITNRTGRCAPIGWSSICPDVGRAA